MYMDRKPGMQRKWNIEVNAEQQVVSYIQSISLGAFIEYIW